MNENKSDEEKIQEVDDILGSYQDYYAIEWPLVTREWSYGKYINAVLKKAGLADR
jgi:hypothetical protein